MCTESSSERERPGAVSAAWHNLQNEFAVCHVGSSDPAVPEENADAARLQPKPAADSQLRRMQISEGWRGNDPI